MNYKPVDFSCIEIANSLFGDITTESNLRISFYKILFQCLRADVLAFVCSHVLIAALTGIHEKRLFSCHLFGVWVGDLLIDHHYRRQAYRRSRLFQAVNLLKGLGILAQSRAILQKARPDLVVINHSVYPKQGGLLRLALRNNAKAILVRLKLVYIYTNYEQSLSKHPTKIDIGATPDITWEDLFERRFRGYDPRLIDAYAGKPNVALSDVLEEQGLNTEKETILVMCHCFTDANHQFLMDFTSYFDWLRRTYEYALKDRQFNWIFKQHPHSKYYGEENYIFTLLKSRPGVAVVPPNYNNVPLYQSVKAVITVNGSAGEEAPCFGAVPIICGNPEYFDDKIMIAANATNYVETLGNMSKVERLDESLIKYARERLIGREGANSNIGILQFIEVRPNTEESKKRHLEIREFYDRREKHVESAREFEQIVQKIEDTLGWDSIRDSIR